MQRWEGNKYLETAHTNTQKLKKRAHYRAHVNVKPWQIPTYVVYLINAYIQTRQLNLIKKYRTCISGVISVVTCHSLPCN